MNPNPFYGAYSEERASFSGTAFYRRADDGKEVEVTMITDNLTILEQYLKSNKDAVPVGQILKSSHREGRVGQTNSPPKVSLYPNPLKLKETT